MKKIIAFFDWWREFTGLPTKQYGSFNCDYSQLLAAVILILLVIVLPMIGKLFT